MIVFGPKNDAATIADARKSGVLTAEKVNVAFEKVSAKLLERRVIESQFVHKGDILMILDPTDNALAIDAVNAQIAQNSAAIESQSATLDAAQKEFERAKQLVIRGAVSQSFFDSAQRAYIEADSSLKELKAVRQSLDVSIKQLLVEKKRLVLRAPEDGKIMNLMYQEGEIVSAGTPAVLLESMRQYYDIYVNETRANRYRPGTVVTGWVPAIKQNVQGIVRFTEAAPSFMDLRMSREHGTSDLTSFQVRIYVTPSEKLLAGMTIEVSND